MFKMSVISKMLDINLLPSLINLFAAYAFWLFEIKFGNKFLIRFDNTFEINLTSTLSKDTGLQFYINLLPWSFFSISFITACFYYRFRQVLLYRQDSLHYQSNVSWIFRNSFGTFSRIFLSACKDFDKFLEKVIENFLISNFIYSLLIWLSLMPFWSRILKESDEWFLNLLMYSSLDKKSSYSIHHFLSCYSIQMQ